MLSMITVANIAFHLLYQWTTSDNERIATTSIASKTKIYYLFTYLIAESVTLKALNNPSFPSTFHTAPLYVARPSASMRKSGWICSHVFFLGFSCSSGGPV